MQRIVDDGLPVILLRDGGSDSASDLCAFERVSDPCSEEVSDLNPDDLTLPLKSAEAAGVDEAIAVLRDFGAFLGRRDRGRANQEPVVQPSHLVGLVGQGAADADAARTLIAVSCIQPSLQESDLLQL